MTTYTPVPTVNTGDLWTAANHNTYMRDNFAAGVPDIFTAAGQIVYATGADAAAALAISTAYRKLAINAGATAPEWTPRTVLEKYATPITISSGVATIAGQGSVYLIAAESGTDDDLDDISGAVAGEQVWLMADSGDTITVKHASSKIYLMGDRDFVLTGSTMLGLWYDGSDFYQIGAQARLGALKFTIGSGQAAVGDGTYDCVDNMPSDFYILGYYGSGDTSGSLDLFLRSDTWNTWPDSGDDITASNPPSWSSAQFVSDFTLTGWTRLVSAGNNLHVGADGDATDINQASLTLLGIWMM